MSCDSVQIINNSCQTTEINVSTGTRGLSAYELAVINGYTGTFEEWLASTSNYLPIKCAIDIIAYKAVTTNLSGELIYCDAGTTSHYFKTCGITETSALAGANANVRYDGLLKNDGWSFTPELPVFLGLEGSITQNSEVGVFCLQIGYARTANEIYIDIKQPIMRV